MRFFDDVNVGDELPELVKGPLTPAHLVRWSASMENWHRIHYDHRYAVEVDKLPGVLVAGSWKQNVLIQILTDWAGESGWLWKIAFQFRGMDEVGDTLTAYGRVTETQRHTSFGTVRLEVGLRNGAGNDGTPGTAAVVLPLLGGPPVPYPFDPSRLER